MPSSLQFNLSNEAHVQLTKNRLRLPNESGIQFSIKGGLFFVLALVPFLPLVSGANTGKVDSPKTEFSLHIHNDRITALIDKEPLYEVLAQLAQRFRFKLHFQETQGIDVVSAQLRETTLEEALRKLLIGKDYAMVKSGPTRGEAESGSGLSVLFVLTRDNGSQSPPHPIFDTQSGVEPAKPITPLADSGDHSNYDQQAKIDLLEEKLLPSYDPSTREAAAELLADLHTPDAEHLLSQALRQDLDEFVRKRQPKRLERVGIPSI